MRQAFALLGLMTLIVAAGGFFAFRSLPETEYGEAPGDYQTQSPSSSMFTLTATDFIEGGKIPSLYTCDGENVSPALRIEGAPEGTQSFVLVMDDADIPLEVKERLGIEKFDHWALYNIPGETTDIPQGTLVGTLAKNTRGDFSYTGPCPPDREHRYSFRLYALSGTLNFIQAPTLDEIENAAKGMMLGSASLTARYERISQ